MVALPIVFHCFTQRELLGISRSLSAEKYQTIVPLFIFPSPLFSKIPHLHCFPICHISIISPSPLGVQFFFSFLLIFCIESCSVTLLFLFYRTLRKEDQVSRQVPKPASGRGGKAVNKLITFSRLLFFSLPTLPLPRRRTKICKNAARVFHQPELLCQICPVVGIAIWNSVGKTCKKAADTIIFAWWSLVF